MDLKGKILRLYESSFPYSKRDFEVFEDFVSLLDSGKIRAAEKKGNKWIVNSWVKTGILLGFKMGKLVPYDFHGTRMFDKHTYPIKKISLEDGIRLVPGGTSVRRGAFIASNVTIMPPSYVNVGAYVDEGTMLDSHSLVGSCAQIGKKCHISAGVQIGGVLEPVNLSPVIVEDEVLMGGNSGIFEGVVVKKRAVIAAGVLLTSSMKIYDVVLNRVIEKDENNVLTVPENSVVVSGSRPASGEFAQKNRISIYTPVIVKYRDDKTDEKSQLEEVLRA